jgi:hypothetical protein
MIKTKIYTENSMPEKDEKKEIVEFLYTHLEEYRDKKEDIKLCFACWGILWWLCPCCQRRK